MPTNPITKDGVVERLREYRRHWANRMGDVSPIDAAIEALSTRQVPTPEMIGEIKQQIITARNKLNNSIEKLVDLHVASVSQKAAPAAASEEALRIALVQAAVPLEGLLASRQWLSLTNETWAEIENGVNYIRAALAAPPQKAAE